MINTFVALDIETTGLNPAEDKIIEIGMAKISDGEIVDSYSTLVNPGIRISERITMITGITDDMVEGKPAIFLPQSRNLTMKLSELIKQLEELLPGKKLT